MLHESTDPNDSVMVSVAESTQGGAALPISLILPAGQGAERLLGLGDIIVPGINVALFRRIDKTNGLTAVRRPQSRNHRRDFRALSFMAVCLP